MDNNTISNHSNLSIRISSKSKEKDKGRLSALISAAKDSSNIEKERKYNRERRSLKVNFPLFGNMKLAPVFKGAVVKDASDPDSPSNTRK